MDCAYINLDRAAERRAFVESSLAAYCAPHRSLRRFAAIDKGASGVGNAPERTSPAEKATFRSHTEAMRSAERGHVFVLEDDVEFGPGSRAAIDQALDKLKPDQWNVLFTDLCIPTPTKMVELLFLRRQLVARSGMLLLDPKQLPFAAATAYVVNSGARARLLALLHDVRSFDEPYELYLRRLIYDGRLRARALFPFATTLSLHADQSNIQPAGVQITNHAMNVFRRLVWLHRDFASATMALDRIDAAFYDDETRAFAKLLQTMLSPNLVRC